MTRFFYCQNFSVKHFSCALLLAALAGISGCAFNPRSSAADSRSVVSYIFSNKNSVSAESPRITIVIDDIGNSKRYESKLTSLGYRVTYAIMPFRPHSRYFSELAGYTGAEVILHLPMESISGANPGAGVLRSSMNDAEIKGQLAKDLEAVPYAVGLNNHMGSLGTQDRRLMQIILRYLKHERLLFLDSVTTPKTVSTILTKELKMPQLSRDIFLDNNDNEKAIRAELKKLRFLARQKGYAVAIGHYRRLTLDLLIEEIPRLEDEGFQIVSLQDLARQINTDKKR